jgi:hypothetical protein
VDIEDKYYLGLGMFVDRYGMVEDQLFVLLMLVSGVRIDTAQAIFSGTRTAAAISFIKRLHEVKQEPLPDRLAEVFAQLNTITTVRDHILHTAIFIDGRSVTSTNFLRAHAERTRKAIDASPERLAQMTHDLSVIAAAFMVHQLMLMEPQKIKDIRQSMLARNSRRAWLYKSS